MTQLAPPDNDFALLDRFTATGDEEAFAEIVKRYAGVVYATSFRVTHDRARAEDVSQEVFFRLLRKPNAVSQSLGGWLHQCATRLALDEVRSETARKRREANRRIETNELTQMASTWQEISPHVDEALAQLPEQSRELLVSHFLKGKSQSTIAVETRTSPATISRRMRDAVAELRAELRRRGVVVAPALLVGLCKMNAPAQAASVPCTLMTELGKMAIVGNASTSGFAWTSVSAWCDAAASKWGWPAEMVKQTVAAAATSAVALVAALLMVHGVLGARNATRPNNEPTIEHRHTASGEASTTAQPQAQDVRVAPAGERGARTVVLFRLPETQGGAVGVTFGDGRSVPVPPPLARRVIENQAGKTLEQLTDESRRSSSR